MPPAFVLSQNQTLRTKMLNNRSCYFTFAHRKLTVAFNVWFISVFLRSHCLPTTISILLSQSDWAHRTIQFFKEHPVHTAQNSPPESFLHFHEKWTSLGFSYQCTGLILSFISASQFSPRQIGNSFQNQHRKPYRFAFINVSVDEFLIYTWFLFCQVRSGKNFWFFLHRALSHFFRSNATSAATEL